MNHVIELRKVKRYRLSAPALFMWAPFDGKPKSGQGVTRDMNTFGVYIKTDDLPPVGARIQLEITLPTLAGEGSGMHLQGEGIVLRCEYGGTNGVGFAASAQLYPESADVVLSQFKSHV